MTALLTSLTVAWRLIISYSYFTGVSHTNDAGQVVKETATTTIYLVRHAEKVTIDVGKSDPDLSPLGTSGPKHSKTGLPPFGSQRPSLLPTGVAGLHWLKELV